MASRAASLVLLAVLLAGVAGAHLAAADPSSKGYWAFIGTYTDGKSKGIYRFSYDPALGQLSNGQLAAATENPSFLAVSPDRRFLFAVNELDKFGGKSSGAVSSFTLDPASGALKFINQQPTGGAHPCHLVIDRAARHVLAANYTGGNVCVLPVGTDGKLGPASALVQHKGAGVDPRRQEGPHAHSINLDRSGRFAVAADLGLDQIFIYRYDPAKGTLTPNDPPALALAPGAGPRHLAFHPSKQFAYVINELDSTLTALIYDPQRGRLKKLQTVPTLPADFKGPNSTAEVKVHPSGKFVFGSNRGHNSIVSYRIDPNTGELAYVGHQGAGIKVPRNFNVDPSGKYLVVANQDSDSLVVFQVDPSSGALVPTRQTASVPSPVCIVFVAKP